MHCCRWTSKPSPRGEDLPRGPAVPIRRSVRPHREGIPPPVRRRALRSWPLLRIASSPAGPLPRSCRGLVSQPRPRPNSGRGRAASPAVGTARPGECWALHDKPALSPLPRPAADLDDASRPRPGWIAARPPRPTAVEGPAAGLPEAAHPDGPPGTSSARGPAPPSAWRGAETTEDDGRLLSPVITVRQLRSSFIRRRRPSSLSPPLPSLLPPPLGPKSRRGSRVTPSTSTLGSHILFLFSRLLVLSCCFTSPILSRGGVLIRV